ncbi:MAG: hypothetical protein JRN18_03010 [Nitrososphaerota archaeon]|nr:hypothetical protein [Nitrososphaerota archaeon]MDG6917355.1 hypothetical protein [Nitrososphaerota archaeon]MDG6919595.1 hypothetical protein [Nitrososphaerota archaeon]MDG6946820.1 hypothetical protein [Nitrososphaerota archaeon]MDG6948084.1 hypothetical protein [Nitrososphaerota archaeon]
MTSPRRRQDSPIESVRLKVTFRADRETAAKIAEKLPSAVVRGGRCVVSIEGKSPGEIAEKAKALLDQVRSVESGLKGFK